MESVCHADDKRRFLHEAAGVLKPGGRLILHDGFSARPSASAEEEEEEEEEEEAILRSRLHSWAVPHIVGADDSSSGPARPVRGGRWRTTAATSGARSGASIS
ncbi:MAG: methyltransferase domain-containing protein [Actinomycetota bacterium]